MEENISIFYTNDFHSNFNNWSRVAGYLKDSIAGKRYRNESCFLLDVGDHVDRVHPISEASLGKANVQLMNELGFDAVTIGNNEGITLSHKDLFHLYDEAEFEVVCANLHSTDSNNPNWLERVTAFETETGVRIGIIGLTAPFNDFYELLGWHISSQFEALDKYIFELKESVDIVVLLSHLGINEDQEIARRFPAIDIIIGGHTHHLLRTGEEVNNSLITAAGKHCAFVGEVSLTWDHTANKLVRKEAFTTDITSMGRDMHTEQKLFELQKQAEEILGKKVIHLNEGLTVNWFKETPLMCELTNTLKTWTQADCAMLNSGLLLDQLTAGDITYSDVHRICPHPINPCVVELKGDELLEVIRASLTKDFMELKLKGFGFRGELLGRMVFAGLEVETGKHENGEEYVKEVLLEGSSLDSNKVYKVATADTFTFGRLLPEVAKSERKDFFLPEFLRDLLVKTLQTKFK
ncbi:bifunctional UDP-sugar hydrolase/5'-nucleotidase [Virgibacillus halodenitrificans]|uniref:bifunctional metallophosphatase/5'-nucleotidase n=1 Tax=Virgibacillus halodenitrificans TaxID=1482 RepID=UPI001367C1A7|nr:bifunctional UDP-sugar hydrolase/5'-nucleotidase [Virgibacillus halodenitrificans]MYL56844.1 bifunctional metallophosphatase/5'-nucleotidase [Virgibacillus halodenitrificans]WHX26862.1 bifunctional UDP-sugar hydrolase/5'-nucleotidase [Virgibacillus halodenitrificans]